MPEIEMPPMDVSRGHHAGDRDTITALHIEKAERRVGERVGYLLFAVDEFASHAGAHIDDHLKGFTGDAEFMFGPVVDGLISAVGTVLFPEAEFAKIAFEAASKIIVDGLKDAVESQRSHEPSATAKLHSAVETLASQVRVREIHAIEEAKKHVPAAVQAGVAQIPEFSSDPAWIEQTCDWLGFPEPDQHSIAAPVRQWLEYEFVGLLARVQAEVEREHGVPGLDDSDLNPDRWEHDARQYEQDLYRKEGEQAWDDAYKMD